MEELEDRIKRHEGYRDHVYLDSEGFPTCGWGHHLRVGSKVPKEVSEIFFEEDMKNSMSDFNKLRGIFGDEVILSLNKIRKGVIIEMIFNMGLPSVLGFRNMWANIRIKNWQDASEEMLDSKWHNQVGRRARVLAELMRKGE